MAIKVVNLSEPDELRRFHREISLTVRLGRAHPNIVTVLDTRTLADGRPAIVMDFFELGSAHDRLRSTGPMAPDDVVLIGRVIGDALAFAHGQRVVHRDVKPQNILILPTSYVLADFGIARSVDSEHTASLERLSYRHASPEVLDGRIPEPTDDLWSLCSTMATLLEGRAPFASDDPDDDTALAYLRRVRTAQRRPLPDDVPAPLVRVIERGMGPDRHHRFQRAEDLIAQLRDLERATTAWAPGSVAQQPIPPPRRSARFFRRTMRTGTGSRPRPGRSGRRHHRPLCRHLRRRQPCRPQPCRRRRHRRTRNCGIRHGGIRNCGIRHGKIRHCGIRARSPVVPTTCPPTRSTSCGHPAHGLRLRLRLRRASRKMSARPRTSRALPRSMMSTRWTHPRSRPHPVGPHLIGPHLVGPPTINQERTPERSGTAATDGSVPDTPARPRQIRWHRPYRSPPGPTVGTDPRPATTPDRPTRSRRRTPRRPAGGPRTRRRAEQRRSRRLTRSAPPRRCGPASS